MNTDQPDTMKSEIELTKECWLTLRSVALKFLDGSNSEAIEASLKEYFENHRNEAASRDQQQLIGLICYCPNTV